MFHRLSLTNRHAPSAVAGLDHKGIARCAVSVGEAQRPREVEILSQRTRGKSSGAAKHLETNEALASHQNELEEQLRLDALARLANDGGERAGPSEQQETPIAYRDPNAYPLSSATGGQLKTNQSFVDGKAEAVLLPINGRLVPFHVSTIKNVSKSEEGAWTFLRINFIAPGAVGVSPQLPPEAAGAAHFVKEISLSEITSTRYSKPTQSGSVGGRVARGDRRALLQRCGQAAPAGRPATH